MNRDRPSCLEAFAEAWESQGSGQDLLALRLSRLLGRESIRKLRSWESGLKQSGLKQSTVCKPKLVGPATIPNNTGLVFAQTATTCRVH